LTIFRLINKIFRFRCVLGTTEIIYRKNSVISGDFPTVLHYIFKGSTIKDYVTEQKVYLKHGYKIYVLDDGIGRKSSRDIWKVRTLLSLLKNWFWFNVENLEALRSLNTTLPNQFSHESINGSKVAKF